MRFAKDEGGATLVYVSLIVAVLVGLTGLSLDSGRVFTARQELQKAADAAALAGAWQLDGTAAGSVQADAAARNGVLTNNQKFGATPGAVTIAAGTAGVDFWRAVPADDDTALSQAAPPYDYIRVTTSAVAQNTTLARVFGAPATVTLSASAVARKGAAICQVTPLFMCLPNPATFDPNAWIGHQVLMKAAQGNSWTNGNWGLLDTPGGSQSAGSLANMIGGVNGLLFALIIGCGLAIDMAAKALQPLDHVGRIADLAELAVADDGHAGGDLSCHGLDVARRRVVGRIVETPQALRCVLAQGRVGREERLDQFLPLFGELAQFLLDGFDGGDRQ